ncbi:MAG: hypothetical protein sL5_05760 [Candidatus Mesenet longicola]|uniref:Uncharacterized protein n=1 Tax=Candidatus Mesenet longicola TaxID=1892558 RepID=A0A8J3MP26_9RICK|nr:MAG: hypothetical protein sGL2_06030 [Candidatus Mesenet longicola]GHM59583.1 MAG: hypothetical protein sL5_05760 [Candidatus Mesenet longicola]
MTEEVIQKLVKKLTEGVKVDIPFISPTQEVAGEAVTFLRKYSTNGTIPLATSTSLITFTLSYFIGFALISTRAESQSIHGYVITASILSSFLILSLILNSWYRAIAKNEKIGTELLNSDLNKGDKGEIDKIKIILDFRGGRTFEYIVPVSLDKQGELIQHIRENRYRILLLSIPIIMPAVTLFAVLAANEFNIKNLYIAIPVLILFFSISLAKLGFTIYKAKNNKMNDYTFSQFSNKDILLNFNSKSSKITIINGQFTKQSVNQEKEKKEIENNEDECCSNVDFNEEEYGLSVTRSGSTDTMYSTDNTEIVLPLFTTDNRQEEQGSWLSGAGAKVGKALGEKIAQPVGQAMCAIEKTCKDISKAAQEVRQMGCDVSELKSPIRQMCKDISSVSKQLKQTSKDVSEAAKQVNQTSADISKFFKELKSYFPSENDNTYSNTPLTDILPILTSNLKAKDDKGCLDDTISNLVDGKVIVTYKKGSTLEFIIPAKKAEAREKMSRFTELNVEGLGVTVGKNGFIFN